MKGDTQDDETVIATLSLRGANPGITLGSSVTTHTILDDDGAPSVTVPIDWALKPPGVGGEILSTPGSVFFLAIA